MNELSMNLSYSRWTKSVYVDNSAAENVCLLSELERDSSAVKSMSVAVSDWTRLVRDS